MYALRMDGCSTSVRKHRTATLQVSSNTDTYKQANEYYKGLPASVKVEKANAILLCSGGRPDGDESKVKGGLRSGAFWGFDAASATQHSRPRAQRQHHRHRVAN